MKYLGFSAKILSRLIKKTYRLFKSVPAYVMGTITHVSTTDSVAALTFDDGPDPFFTPRFLDILKKYNAHATFFMIGEAAERYPDLVQKIAQGGHAIGNHSWDHPSFPSITGRERRKQIRASAKAVAPFGQKLFRPPYGHQTVASRIDAILLRYKVIAWDMNACDWEKHDAQWMANRLINRLKPGSIILLHDALWDIMEKDAKDRVPVLEALDIFLEKVSRQFRFVTIPELLRRGRVQKQNWYVKDHNDW